MFLSVPVALCFYLGVGTALVVAPAVPPAFSLKPMTIVQGEERERRKEGALYAAIQGENGRKP